jgi:hypothetical protein
MVLVNNEDHRVLYCLDKRCFGAAVRVVDNGQDPKMSRLCLLYKYILTFIVVQCRPYRLAYLTVPLALQSLQQSAGNGLTLRPDKPHRPAAIQAQCVSARGQYPAPP